MNIVSLSVGKIETTRAGDAYRIYRPGRRRAWLFSVIPIPVRLAEWLHG